MRYETGNFDFEVRNERGGVLEPHLPKLGESGIRIRMGSGRSVEIQPNSEIEQTAFLSDRYDFSLGEWSVRATLLTGAEGASARVVSNWTKVEVTSEGQLATPFTKLELTANPAQLSVVTSRTPLRFELSLRNLASEAVMIDNIDDESGYVVEARAPSGLMVPYQERALFLKRHWTKAYPRKLTPLGPGDTIRTTIDVGSRLQLIGPGKYVLSFHRLIVNADGVEYDVAARDVELVVLR